MTHLATDPRRQPPRSAFTLLEVVLALFIIGLLMSAIASAVVLAAKAAPDPAGPAASLADAGEVASLLANELQYAQSVTELTPTALTFTVPDASGAMRTVRYYWSATSDKSLRRVSNGTEGILLPACANFALTYDRRAELGSKTVQTTATGDEILLSSFLNYSSGTVTNKLLDVSSSSLGAQVFQIDSTLIPANTTKVEITRVKLWMKGSSTGGPIMVGIYKSTGNGNPQPASTPLGQVTTLSSGSIPTSGYQWIEVPITGTVLTSTNQDQCIVVSGAASTAAATIQYLYNTKAQKDGPKLIWSTDGGATWQPGASLQDDQDMKFYVYGICTTTTSTRLATTDYSLRTVSLSVAAGKDASRHLDTAIRLLNQPGVTPP
jgi:prepilin-type N-terminal cleavage/methylation domain-containing protein